MSSTPPDTPPAQQQLGVFDFPNAQSYNVYYPVISPSPLTGAKTAPSPTSMISVPSASGDSQPASTRSTRSNISATTVGSEPSVISASAPPVAPQARQYQLGTHVYQRAPDPFFSVSPTPSDIPMGNNGSSPSVIPATATRTTPRPVQRGIETQRYQALAPTESDFPVASYESSSIPALSPLTSTPQSPETRNPNISRPGNPRVSQSEVESESQSSSSSGYMGSSDERGIAAGLGSLIYKYLESRGRSDLLSGASASMSGQEQAGRESIERISNEPPISSSPDESRRRSEVQSMSGHGSYGRPSIGASLPPAATAVSNPSNVSNIQVTTSDSSRTPASPADMMNNAIQAQVQQMTNDDLVDFFYMLFMSPDSLVGEPDAYSGDSLEQSYSFTPASDSEYHLASMAVSDATDRDVDVDAGSLSLPVDDINTARRQVGKDATPYDELYESNKTFFKNATRIEDNNRVVVVRQMGHAYACFAAYSAAPSSVKKETFLYHVNAVKKFRPSPSTSALVYSTWLLAVFRLRECFPSEKVISLGLFSNTE